MSISICIAEFPTEMISFEQEGVEDKQRLLNTVLKTLRSQITAQNIQKTQNAELGIRAKTNEDINTLRNEIPILQSMLKSGQITVFGWDEKEMQGSMKNHISDELETYIKVVGLLDIKLEVCYFQKVNTFID